MADMDRNPNRQQPAPNATTRNRVVVGCRLPHGLTTQLYELGEGEDKKPIMVKKGEPVRLNGVNSDGPIRGIGLTEVDADYWRAWFDQNKTFAPVKTGMIFAHESRNNVTAIAAERAKEKTGFEPIDPDKPGHGVQRVPEKELKQAAAMAGA